MTTPTINQHDEMACVTNATAMYVAVLDEADELSTRSRCSTDQVLELRRRQDRLPKLLAQLSPTGRAIMRDHFNHYLEMVAFVHQAETIISSRAGD
jgi:hypothetical protein